MAPGPLLAMALDTVAGPDGAGLAGLSDDQHSRVPREATPRTSFPGNLTARYWETLLPISGQPDIRWLGTQAAELAARYASLAKLGDSAITRHFASSAATSDSATTVRSVSDNHTLRSV